MIRSADSKHMVIGVTGGIGSGKTVFSGYLRDAGAYLINADSLVHELYENDAALIKTIGEMFGNETVSDGRVDRSKLAGIVFRDRSKLKALNRLVHKRVGEEIGSRIKQHIKDGHIVVDAPIPVKRGFLEYCDMVVVLKSSKVNRIERIRQRSNLSDEQMARVFKSQPGEREYEKIADLVIVNDGSREDLRNKAISFIKEHLS